MPRRARLAIAGIPWHIIQRGNNRCVCFHADSDYLLFLDQLGRQCERFDCAIHAFCLMTNHVHLLLTPQTAEGPSLMMKNLGQWYTQYVNRTYSRTGTLWDGRFKSCLAQDQLYVMTCYRYIELNPVRAGMVEHPELYRWSSYSANGAGHASELITHHSDYLALGNTLESCRENYRRLLIAGLDTNSLERIREATQGNYVLGNSNFEAQIGKALRRRVVPGRSGRPERL